MQKCSSLGPIGCVCGFPSVFALIFQMLPNNTNTISGNSSRTSIMIRVTQKENDDDEKVNTNNTRSLVLSEYICHCNIITTLLHVFNCVRDMYFTSLYICWHTYYSINKANALKWARLLSSKNYVNYTRRYARRIRADLVPPPRPMHILFEYTII